jgi:UDP-N-acetylglucosamine--dolichyl-phosphate N-acetylglucosaminephosphotransferase
MIANQVLPIVSVSLILSAFTYLVTPNLGKKLKKMKIVGIDVHKASRPSIPEMGGLVVFASILTLLSFVYIMTGTLSVLVVGLATLLFGVYGLFDDLMQLGKYKKLALSIGIGLLLLVPFAPIIVLVPLLLFLTISLGNIFNLFAGFNGLEVGCTSMIALFFSFLCLLTGNLVPFYLSFGLFLVLLGFLMHNKYPARIFPGNVGTMTIGGFFAGICLYYNLYYLLIPLLFLHIADVVLKGVSAGYFSSSEHKPTKVNGDNVLVPGNDYLSLSRLVLKLRPMTERQLVSFFWAASLLVGVTAVIITGVLL